MRIGVAIDYSEHPMVEEFFELFKVGWEICQTSHNYDLVICSSREDLSQFNAHTVVVYESFGAPEERTDENGVRGAVGSEFVLHDGARVPIYCGTTTFPDSPCRVLLDERTSRAVVSRSQKDNKQVIRIGYDLFAEVRYLLTTGQPVANASCPTLDLHIVILRDLIRSFGIDILEIPAIPKGYRFIACLTHDIDHPRIHQHKFDHTSLGFLFRATVGSVAEWIRGHVSSRNMISCWIAALKLPFVYVGVAQDFWSKFDHYLEIEEGNPSTFFAIPFKNRPGATLSGTATKMRSSGYAALEIADQLKTLVDRGSEVGLHGIDSWLSWESADQEFREIRSITGKKELGVRMHWLFFDNCRSPKALESAGAVYDSSVGYNETVGFRAGTIQAYKLPGTEGLLELPMHVMDTALFFSTFLNLSPKEAEATIDNLIDHAAQHGGCITVNWHDRSIAPERLWTDTYKNVLNRLREQGAWFATASQAALWFQIRRFIKFDNDGRPVGALQPPQSLPGFVVQTSDGTRLDTSLFCVEGSTQE